MGGNGAISRGEHRTCQTKKFHQIGRDLMRNLGGFGPRKKKGGEYVMFSQKETL